MKLGTQSFPVLRFFWGWFSLLLIIFSRCGLKRRPCQFLNVTGPRICLEEGSWLRGNMTVAPPGVWCSKLQGLGGLGGSAPMGAAGAPGVGPHGRIPKASSAWASFP